MSKRSHGPGQPKKCERCGIVYTPRHDQQNWRRFCSHACAMLRTGAASPAWKGGGNYVERGGVVVHRAVAERALGKPLDGRHPVHHHDENRSNNANSNLVICENHAYHKLLHARARIVRMGGDPNIEQHCWGCKRLLPFSEFHKDQKQPLGHQKGCKGCKRQLRLAVSVAS